MSWTATGVEKLPFVDPGKLFDHLFLNLTPVERARRAEILTRDRSILDTVGEQFKALMKKAGSPDRDRLDQFQTSLREMEKVLSGRRNWLKKDKPHFEYSDTDGDGIEAGYNAIFDMLGYAFQTDLTRVASVEFPASLNYTDIEGGSMGVKAVIKRVPNEIGRGLVSPDILDQQGIGYALYELSVVQAARRIPKIHMFFRSEFGKTVLQIGK